MEYLAALVLGLMGSFHCVGMCGPIAIALPLGGRSWGSRITGGLLYNFGRTITYGVLGAVFGIVGAGLSLAGLQKWVSIIMGSIMVISVVFPSVGHKINTGGGMFSFMNGVKKSLGKLFRKSSNSSLFLIGLLNGLLPCGLVYMAMAGALATGSMAGSTLFMVIFGLGTIPMLFTVSMIGSLAGKKLKHIINKVIPVVVVIIGILFILRGLELGIKYISPPPQKLQVKEKSEPAKVNWEMHKCGQGKCGSQ
jgi:sulfite exporter TauE/SafE